MASGLGGDLEDKSLVAESVSILGRGYGSQHKAREQRLFWTRTGTYAGLQEKTGEGTHLQSLSGGGGKAQSTEKAREEPTNTQVDATAGVPDIHEIRKIGRV